MTEKAMMALAAELGIDLSAADAVIVGDASGNTASDTSGWACTLYMPRMPAGQRFRGFFGGASCGTVNYAELMPALTALWWHSSAVGNPEGVCVVHIVTDSQLTAYCGSGQYARRANMGLWASIDKYVSMGYTIQWHWTRRNTNAFGTFADKVAGQIRGRMDEQRKCMSKTTSEVASR